MKKLVTAFAACALAGLVNAQVESVNIVGYQTLSLPTGYKMTTSTFVPVGSAGTDLRLGDIVPNGSFDYFAGDNVQFFAINGDGTVSSTVSYMANYGWFDFNNPSVMVDDMTIPAGTGMFVYTSGTGVEFLVSGEVKVDSFALLPSAGYTVVGNSTPVAITLSDIVPNAQFDYFSGDNIQFFNPDGSGTVSITASYMTGYGWFDFNNPSVMLDDTVLNPGDSCFAYVSNAGVSFTFPGITIN